MKALVGAFNQEKALVGAFSVIVQPVVEPMDHFTALFLIVCSGYNMEIDMIDPLVIRQEQRSYETGMFQITSDNDDDDIDATDDAYNDDNTNG